MQPSQYYYYRTYPITTALGLDMFGGSNVLQTTLNPEPMMKMNTIENPTGSNTSVTWTQTIYPMALGQMNIYYISIYVVYNGPQSSTSIVIPVSEIPNNDNGTISFGTFQATNYFTSATVTWEASSSSFSISVSGTNTTSTQSTMYINGIFCYLDTSTFELPEPY
jgi:hypothetical protein